MHVLLDVTASRKEMPIEVTLTTKCDLLLEGVDLGEPDEVVPHANYRMSVREVGVKVGAPLIEVETRQWANQLVASKLPKEFAESLRFSIPLNYPLDSQLGFTRDESQKLEFGSYTVRFSMPKSHLWNRETFRVTPGIPTANGVWFLGSITPSMVQGSARESIVDERDASEGELQRLRRRVADMVSGFPRLDSDVAVYANASFFNKVIQAFNSLPQEKRVSTLS